MSNIITYTRHEIDPCEPKAENIFIEDIAHALSVLCRSGGHFPVFYSVGQHSVACANEAVARGYSRKVQLACLLHDASEAYIADITRPVKQRLSEYLVFESKLQNVIYSKFIGTLPTEDEMKLVCEVDDAMLYHEFKTLMDIELFECKDKLLTKPDFEFHGFEKAENDFLNLFLKLMDIYLQKP